MKRFIIYSTQRTGSTLLKAYLDQHPESHCYGEIFRTRREDESYKGFTRSSAKNFVRHLFSRGQAVSDYLALKLESEPSLKAAGFKLMYNQSFPALDSWIRENQVSIIHLIRRNSLKKLLSEETAKQSGTYHIGSSKDKKPEVTRVHLEPKKIVQLINKTQQIVTQQKQQFPDNPYTEVFYEDLVADRDGEVARLYSFLELPEFSEFHIPLKKINPDSISDIVENYQELENALEQAGFGELLRT